MQLANPDRLARFGLLDSDVDRLVECLAQDDLQGRRLIRGALKELGAGAVPALTRALRDGDLPIRRAAVEMLRQIDGAVGAVHELTNALTDEDWLVRMWAADALSKLGLEALSAVSALERAVGDPVVQVRTAAFIALRWIRGL